MAGRVLARSAVATPTTGWYKVRDGKMFLFVPFSTSHPDVLVLTATLHIT